MGTRYRHKGSAVVLWLGAAVLFYSVWLTGDTSTTVAATVAAGLASVHTAQYVRIKMGRRELKRGE